METLQNKLYALLKIMVDNNASDIHISADERPFMRVHGTLQRMDVPPLSREESEELIFCLLTEDGKRAFNELQTLDFSFKAGELGRFRTNIFRQQGMVTAALRRIVTQIPTFDELALPQEVLKSFCHLPHGLVLICGPVGTGKTTTLACMLNYINSTRSSHVITIEDPIEYTHKNNMSLMHQRELRVDTQSFSSALKFILREDPDVVVIGEMRDLDTVSAAVTIAESGHLVMATLHTGDTSESVQRIVDMFPANQQTQIVAQLSYSLAGVMNQILIPKADGKGRIVATEIMVATPAIRNLIRENKIEQIYSHLQMGQNLGMHTLNQSLCDLVRSKQITKEIAFEKTNNAKELARLLEK